MLITVITYVHVVIVPSEKITRKASDRRDRKPEAK